MLLFFIKTHYTYPKAPMDIVFSMYIKNYFRNDNMYKNKHHFIIKGQRGQLQTSKGH